MSCRCCGPCFTAQGNNQFETPCCKCIPKRICVEVYPPANLSSYCDCSDPPVGDPYGPMVKMTLSLDCTGQHNSYTGSFRCGTGANALVDLTFKFEAEENSFDPCYFVLESEALGYTYPLPVDGYPATDNRLRVIMGGSYGTDLETRRTECASGGPFEFLADLSSRIPGCGEARIVVNAADYMAKPATETNTGPGERPCSCACMLVFLTRDGVETQVKACYDTYSGGWAGLFDISPYEQYAFTIYHEGELEYAGGTSLRLESDLGDGVAQSIHCSDCDDRMNVSWDLGYGTSIRTFCAKEGGCPECSIPCSDCKCFCRCVCVIYSSEVDSVSTVVNACWDEYNYEWTADVGSRTLHFRLLCNETTGETEMVLTDQDGATLGVDSNSGGGPVPANCPDISATWAITEYGDAITTVSIVCDNCGDCTNLIQTPCCEVPVPLVLYATVSGVHSCWQYVMDPDPTLTALPVTVIPLTFHPAVGAGMPYWEGTRTITGYLLDKRCSVSDPGTLGYVKMTVRVLCGVEIDSVDFQCFGPDNSFLGGLPTRVDILAGSGSYNTCSPSYITAKLGDPSDYMTGGVNLFGALLCRPDGSGGDDRGYFFDIVVTE